MGNHAKAVPAPGCLEMLAPGPVEFPGSIQKISREGRKMVDDCLPNTQVPASNMDLLASACLSPWSVRVVACCLLGLVPGSPSFLAAYRA